MRETIREGEGRPEWKRPLLMGLFGVGVLLLLLLALAILQYRSLLPTGGETLWVRSCLFLSSVLSGFIGARRTKRKKLLSAALGECALLLFVILLGIFTKHGGAFNISVVFSILILICGGFAGSLLSAAGKNHSKNRRRK